MSELPTEPIYAGEHTRNLDAKGRVTVPSRWRFVGDDRDVFLAWFNKEDGCIAVFPPAKTQQVREKMRDIPYGDKRGRQFRRLFAASNQFGCDAQGRIKLDQRLIDAAGIGKELVLEGQGDTFSIWSAERYNAYTTEDFDVLQAMSDFGI